MSRPPFPAAVLGAAGLLPFILCALVAHLSEGIWAHAALQGLLYYGAAILAFMGGCRWGFACADLGKGPGWGALLVSVAPALLAFGALLVGGAPAMLLLAGGLLLLLAADIELTRAGGAPAWWPVLRAPLSLTAAVALLAGVAA